MSTPDDNDEPTKGDHADHAWLTARERGEAPLPPIDPQRAAAYQGLQKLIASLPDAPVPDEWNDDVLAAISAAEAAKPLEAVKPATSLAPTSEPISIADRRTAVAERAPRKRSWQLPGAVALAATTTLAIWLTSKNQPLVLQGLQVSVLHDEGMRANVVEGEAALGDVLVIEAGTSDIDELRVYRDDQELVLRCPAPSGPSSANTADATCERKPGLIIGRLRVIAPGRYRAVGLRPAPASPPSGSLAADLADCHCQSHTTTPIVAR